MPTTRPRHTLTETDELARALDAAAERWPEDRHSRTRLLARLVDLGWTTLRVEVGSDEEDYQAAVLETAGMFRGLYRPNYLEELRKDWPE